jgi:hypothetical protein
VDCCSVFFLREHFMNSVINKNHYTELNWIKSSCFFFLNIYCQFVLYLGSLIRFNKGLVSRHMSAHWWQTHLPNHINHQSWCHLRLVWNAVTKGGH